MGQEISLRYDEIPLGDLLTALVEHRRDVRRNLLPKANRLFSLRLTGLYQGLAASSPVEVSFFLVSEENPILGEMERFLLIHGPSSLALSLQQQAFAVRDALKKWELPVLFRIDPKWGLITGYAKGALDSLVKWDRPNAYLCMYITEDPSHPSLALSEYVSTQNRPAWDKAFQFGNGTPPKKSSFLSRTIAAMSGKKPLEAHHLTWTHIHDLLRFIPEKLDWQLPSVSLIFYPCDAEEGDQIILPKEKMAVVNGLGNFFASLGELE